MTPQENNTDNVKTQSSKEKTQATLLQQNIPQNLMTALLQLESAARHSSTIDALLFTITNATARLIPFRQSFLYELESNQIVSVSGSPTIEKDAPYIVWCKALAKSFVHEKASTCKFSVASIDESLKESYRTYFAKNAIAIPLLASGRIISILVLSRDLEFNDKEITLLNYLQDVYSHAYLALKNSSHKQLLTTSFLFKKKFFLIAAVLILIALCTPIRMSALGQAEVIATNPAIVRAACDGIVQSIEVSPNSEVKKDEVLVRLNVQALSDQLETAIKTRDLEAVRYQQAAQKALDDNQYGPAVALAKASVAQKDAEITYLEQLLMRSTLKSPIDGIALFEDSDEWMGRPVRTGERIMSIASKGDSHILIWLSSEDMLDFENGSKVSVFLNSNPNTALSATLYRSSYSATPRPEGYMAYRLDAKFENNLSPRVGLRGVAKVYGTKAPLAYYLFRRPFSALRQFLGI